MGTIEGRTVLMKKVRGDWVVMEGELLRLDAVGVVGRSQIPLWLHRR
ncbi:hypothetical protein QUB16_19365 [Microcoleus sp. D3_18a_C4]